MHSCIGSEQRRRLWCPQSSYLLHPKTSAGESDPSEKAIEIISERYRFPFNELLVGCFLLPILFIKGVPSSIIAFLGGALTLEFILILAGQKVFTTRSPGLPTGAWLLIPLPTILASYDSDAALNLVSTSFLAFIFHLFLQNPTRVCFTSVPIWIACTFLTHQSLSIGFILLLIFITFLLGELLLRFPSSLTIWEANLIAQICFLFNANTSLFIIPLLCVYTIIRFKMLPNFETLGTLSVIVVWLITLAGDFADHLLFIQEEFLDPTLLINFSPIKFVRDLITPVNIVLVTTLWAPLSVLAILVVLFINAEENPGARSTFALRKLFHFLAGVVFATGLLVSPHFLSVAAACVLLAFLTVEWSRRRGPSHISKTLSEFLEPFRDSRDSGELIFTPIALLLGLSLPIWDFGFEHYVSPRTWIGVITIAVGDSVAALVGRKWGHHFYHWPGSHRTIIGSMASFLSQMLLWMLLTGFYGWSWQVGLLPLGMGVLAEAYTEQIDNLAVPLLVMSLIPAAP
ncbi:unnamed protein product [Hymenolepis diminuta]|uniref:dolichol kinase n=1 Tax=Hymenolepis diminuta TaxID=6216 RepID=A0A564ZE34_HYMDI|nr:unnamed protein product [Hymenolepis diminuta]